MTGGQASQTVSAFSLEDQIKELESFIQPLEKNISTLKEQISKLEFEKQTALSLISNYMAEKNSYEVKLAEDT